MLVLSMLRILNRECRMEIEWAYQTANEVVKKEQEQNKWHYDHRVRCAQLKVGDKILLKCIAFKGKHKIQDRWENTIFEVVGQPLGKIPVFFKLNQQKEMIAVIAVGAIASHVQIWVLTVEHG